MIVHLCITITHILTCIYCTEAEFLVILCTCIYNLRSCHLRLTLGHASLCKHIIGTERRAQVKPPSSIFEQYEYHGQNLSSISGKPGFVAQ
jgi:hypothetical protein